MTAPLPCGPTPYVVGSYGPVEITAGPPRWFRRRRYLAVCALCRNGYLTRSSADAWDIARDHTCAGRTAAATDTREGT